MEKKRKKSKIISEYKEFISRGNVIDLAVGIIIGSAFTAIVNSLVNDVIMPVVGFIIGGVNFEQLKWVLVKPVEGVTEEVAIRIGAFLQRAIDFLIIAAVVFLMVKGINTFRSRIEERIKAHTQEDEHEPEAETESEPEPEPEPEPEEESKEILLLAEIRDLLKNSQSE